MLVDDFIFGVNSVDKGNLEIKKISLLLKSIKFGMNEYNACEEILQDVCDEVLASSNKSI